MKLELQTTTCPACQGFGVTGNPGSYITCTACQGTAIWQESPEGKRLVYRLPQLLSPQNPNFINFKRYLRYGLGILSLLATSLSGFLLLIQANSISDILWRQGMVSFLFGFSGIASVWAIASFYHHQTSSTALHIIGGDLADLVNKEIQLDLNSYANPRLEHLIEQAALVARDLRQNFIDECILLLTLLKQPRIQAMLVRLERSPELIADSLRSLLIKTDTAPENTLLIHPEVRLRYYAGIDKAIEQDFPYLDLEDIFLDYLEHPGRFAEYFTQLELKYADFYAVSRWYASDQERQREWAFWRERGRTRPKGYMNRAWTALPTPFLDQFSYDLTKHLNNSYIVTKIRDTELNHVLQILGRTEKNSVLLVGEPGVGKKELLAAIAKRMVEENVPEILKDKRLLSVDLGALLSSSNHPEQSVQKALDEVGQAGNVILAITDIQFLVGTSEGALDAASLLYQAVSRGYLQIISTATYADYHRYVESNQNLSSLLETVEIKEVSPEQAIAVLEEESSIIEIRQKVFLTYPAIEASVKLAHRYLPDKVLPTSALDILDEAASQAFLTKKHWVNKEDVEKVVEQKTQIPIASAQEQEAKLLLNMETELHKRIIGQEAAVKAVSEALRRARAGLQNGKRPIASFLFVGPTGVGKTETAKALSQVYFGDKSPMIRLDMSEYQDNRAVYKLIGAPAADSDSFTEGGSLTQPIREHPFSLILLDELEKAEPNVLNLFLQLLEDGRLTENTGRTVYYNNCIIVATSNAGSNQILDFLRQGLAVDELSKQILNILTTQFKPEFINRFDAVVPFQPLRKEELYQVANLMLKETINKAAEQNYRVSFTPETVQKIAELGFDPVFGARPLRRVIQEKVEGLLAKLILEKALGENQELRITPEMIN